MCLAEVLFLIHSGRTYSSKVVRNRHDLTLTPLGSEPFSYILFSDNTNFLHIMSFCGNLLLGCLKPGAKKY